MNKLQNPGSVLVGVLITAALAACGGGGGDPISSAISGGGSGAVATTTGAASTGTVTTPATGIVATTSATTSPTQPVTATPSSGFAKATLSGIFANCPLMSGATKEWWTCMAGLEFVGVIAFGSKTCSMRIRTDGAFEFTNNGTTKITNKPVDLYAAGSYVHVITAGMSRGHVLKANIFTTNSPVLTDPPLFVIGVDLDQTITNPTYQVSYGEDICKLNIQ